MAMARIPLTHACAGLSCQLHLLAGIPQDVPPCSTATGGNAPLAWAPRLYQLNTRSREALSRALSILNMLPPSISSCGVGWAEIGGGGFGCCCPEGGWGIDTQLGH